MSGRTKRRGFTLIELLVVISIIGMLMALLLPAIQSARESGRRNTCANNMRNFGIAAIQWEANKKFFPPYANFYGRDTTKMINGRVGSYVVPLLPYLERADLYKMWTNPGDANAFTKVDLEIASCPSDPGEVQVVGSLAFVINSGPGNSVGATDPEILTWHAAGGVSHREIPLTTEDPTMGWRPTRVGIDYVQANDGTTSTLLLSENLQAYSWALESESVHNDAINNARNRTTFVWWTVAAMGAPSSKGINADRDYSTEPLPTSDALAHARPSSRHVGGVNVFFVGGNFRYINEDIDYSVYRQLMSPKSAHFDSTPDKTGDSDNRLMGDDAY